MKLASAAMLFGLVAGCARPQPQPGHAAADLRASGGNASDLGDEGRDLAIDPGDMRRPPFDLAQGSDLGAPDSSLPDLGPADLVGATDLTRPPDLKPAADMACAINMPQSTCGVFPQCGCASGQNCNIANASTGQAGCVPAGSTSDSSVCTGLGDGQCAIGSTCVDGVCVRFCGSDADCPGQYRKCRQIMTGGDMGVPGYKVCTTYCDPVTPSSKLNGFQGCGPGANCAATDDGITFCSSPTTSTGTQGADCTTKGAEDQTKCAPGYVCASTSTSTPSTCMKWCKVASSSSGCPVNTTCSRFTTRQYAGATEIGACL